MEEKTLYRLETDLNSDDINGNKECDKFKMNFRIIFHRAGYLVECARTYMCIYTHIYMCCKGRI